MLAGLEKATKGTVKINGREVTSMTEKELAEFRQETTGFIFQSYNLLASMNAVENVAMPLMFKGVHPLIRNNRAKKMLRAVGLEKRLYHKPTQMSGGQQQRVGIARALISKPPVVFADEPTSELDDANTREVFGILKETARSGKAVLVVSHEKCVPEYADIVYRMEGGSLNRCV
jgi:putative ABC transport system ATP-binding protein